MSCNKPRLYNNDLWSFKISPDQLGINRYLWSIYNDVVGSRILHVGIGASALFHAFREEAERIDGITIQQSEIDVGVRLSTHYIKNYRIWNLNKYDGPSFDAFEVPSDYDFIVDNNLKQHACCNEHWHEYFTRIASRLAPAGQLITHTKGFGRWIKTEVEALTVEELRGLCAGHPLNLSLECRTDLQDRFADYPVIIRRNG